MVKKFLWRSLLSDSSIILTAAWLWANLQHKTCGSIAVGKGESALLLLCSCSRIASSTVRALNVRCYFAIYRDRKEMLPGIPWKGPLCWRDCLLHVYLSGCLLQSSISHYPVVVKKNLQKCSFHISKTACSETAHLSVPSLQGWGLFLLYMTSLAVL